MTAAPMICPDEAREKEDTLSEEYRLLPESEWPKRPEAAARLMYDALVTVGDFARTEDGELFFFRHATLAFYPVTGPHSRAFYRYMAMLFDRDSQKTKTKEAIEHLAEHLRHRARRMFVELEGLAPGVWRRPLRMAKKKKKSRR